MNSNNDLKHSYTVNKISQIMVMLNTLNLPLKLCSGVKMDSQICNTSDLYYHYCINTRKQNAEKYIPSVRQINVTEILVSFMYCFNK
jgi:hypothetical protein